MNPTLLLALGSLAIFAAIVLCLVGFGVLSANRSGVGRSLEVCSRRSPRPRRR